MGKLIDQKKDKRLAFLLSQTDEYINQLTEMVSNHKKDHRAKQREIKRLQKAEERAMIPEHMRRIPVKNKTTGKVLKGEEPPLLPELEAWLEKHPDFEPIPDYDSDQESEEETEKDNEEKD